MLGYSFWERHYGNANVIGQKMLVNGHPIIVVGIAPSEFHGVLSGRTPDLYLPISMAGVADPAFNGFDNPGWQSLTMIGRLRSGISRNAAQAALNPLFTSILRDELSTLRIKSQHSRKRILSVHLTLDPAAAGLNELERSWKKPLMVLIFAAGGLLLIACSNLASLLMVRAAARNREIAIRRAVGASRPQIISQLLSESVLLAFSGERAGSFVVGCAYARNSAHAAAGCDWRLDRRLCSVGGFSRLLWESPSSPVWRSAFYRRGR